MWRSRNHDVCDSPNLYFAVEPNGKVKPCCDFKIDNNFQIFSQNFVNNFKTRIIHKDIPQDDPVRRKPSIKLANDKYQWNPVVDLEVGLENTINYFKDNLD